MKNMKIVEVAPMREQVADIIRTMIVKGELEGGQKISERQVSAMLNVSTTPVKEAFRSLQAEGFLYSVPRKGSFVSEHSINNLKQYSYMRSVLDGVAAHFAATTAMPEDIRYMEQELAAARDLIESDGDSGEISNHNSNYHMRMRQATQNDFLMKMTNMIGSVDHSMRKVVNRTSFDELMLRQKEHEEILKKVKEGNADDAERLMVEHVRNGAKKFWK